MTFTWMAEFLKAPTAPLLAIQVDTLYKSELNSLDAGACLEFFKETFLTRKTLIENDRILD
jgi:hypothetical protein